MRIPFLLLLLPFLAAALNIGGLKIEIDQENARYRASRQGGVMSGWLNQKTEIFLKAKSIDPLKSQDILREYLQSVKEINPSFPSSFESKDAIDFPKAFLVQFHTQAFPEFKEELENAGVSVHFSFPSQAFLVTIPSPSVLTTIREMKAVRWIGEYFPIYKLGPDVFPFVNEKTQAASLHLNIMLIQRGEALQGRIAKIIERRFGGQVHAMITEGFRLEITIPVQKIFLLLSLREVLYADLWRVAGEDMDIARLNGGLDYMSKVHGYNGEGVRAEVMDSGLYTSHTDFKSLNIMIHGGNGISTSHGSSVFGVVFGDGTTNPNGLGCISKANASIFAAYDILSASYTRYRHTEELVDPEGMYRAVFQTNSWGDAQTTLYTTISAEMDDIIYLNDIVILQSQSNTGNRNSRPQAWAKNIVSIGAFNHYNTLSRADDRWGGGASIGPAEDGRQKPDLCNFYDNILTPTNNNNGYTQFGGTSGATPITAGHFGVFFQMWADGVFSGGVGKERDVFDSRPHSSTAKAIMINTASQYDFNANSRDLIRVHQGWGTANLAQLHGLAQTNGWSLPILVDESEPIASLEVISYQMIVDSSSAPNFLKATLVYRDPMPAVSASRQLINNLDLMVTSPSGVVYYGNYGLNQGTCSLAGGDPSDVDNVENVFICGAESGIWTISVIGTEVIQDTNPATEIVDAFFSLVVTKGRQD